MTIQPERKTVRAFTVAGVSVRTQYADELHPATARLPALWGQFIASGMGLQTPQRVEGGQAYGVYSDYESDETGHYTATVGVAVHQASTSLASVQVPAGEYLVFSGRGPMPQTIVQTWGAVWAHFQQELPYRRAFTVDFEAYAGLDTVEIHIGIVPAEPAAVTDPAAAAAAKDTAATGAAASRSVTLYGIAHCDTVKKSRQWFAEHGVALQFHDFSKQGLDAATLQQWSDALGWGALLNRRGTTWRKLDAQTQAGASDSAGAQALMLQHTSLIKRPVVAIGAGSGQTVWTVGFAPQQWGQTLGLEG